VNAWWWVPIGLAAWFLVATVTALCIGPVLRRASQARESLDRQVTETMGGDESPRDERQAPAPTVTR
jgi:flagellar biosynthesis/type III secretory pathway M-ring protein FliF/YscJ